MTVSSSSRFLVAYDIHRPQRAAQARQMLRAYSENTQKSVFEASLSPGQQQALVEDLTTLKNDADDWLILEIDPRAKVHRLGAAQKESDSATFAYWG